MNFFQTLLTDSWEFTKFGCLQSKNWQFMLFLVEISTI